MPQQYLYMEYVSRWQSDGCLCSTVGEHERSVKDFSFLLYFLHIIYNEREYDTFLNIIHLFLCYSLLKRLITSLINDVNFSSLILYVLMISCLVISLIAIILFATWQAFGICSYKYSCRYIYKIEGSE